MKQGLTTEALSVFDPCFSRGSEFGGGMRRYLRLLIAFVLFLAMLTETLGQDKEKGKPPPLKTTSATPAETLKVLKGFRAELLYSVPKEKRGSWVNMCVDPKGRLIVSDQYGPLYRITPPPVRGQELGVRRPQSAAWLLPVP